MENDQAKTGQIFDIQTTIERLRKEKAEYERKKAEAYEAQKRKEKEDVVAGQRAGRLWAYSASYEEILECKPIITGEVVVVTDMSILESIQKKDDQSIDWARGWLESVQDFLTEAAKITGWRLFKVINVINS